jgi:plasmid maintenance system antidote protein VapI
MGQGNSEFRSYLQDLFIERCRKNPRYSIRAFARSLRADHSTLSQILRGTRPLSNKAVSRFSSHLGLGPQDLDRILKTEVRQTTDSYHDIQADTYTAIADWYHFAIFEMVTLKGFDPAPRSIATRLGISVPEAQAAIERLLRLNLLTRDSKNRLHQTQTQITTTGNPFTTAAFRKLQQGVLEGAMTALNEVPIAERDQSSMTMAIDSRRLPEAKERIKKFRRELCEFLQEDKMNRDAVYQLGISLFPLTRRGGKKDTKKGKSK